MKLQDVNSSRTEAKNGKKQLRNSNLEGLRILSMLMIVAFHATRAGFVNTSQPFIIYFSGVTLGSWGLLGVDLFLIISAWFLCIQPFRLQKVISIVFQTFSWVMAYSIIYVLHELLVWNRGLKGTLYDCINYTLSGLFQPLWCKYYWFITTYFFMLLLSPLLNRMLEAFSQKQIKRILFLFLFVPIYAQFAQSAVTDIFWFLYVYLFIGYTRRYGCRFLESHAKPYAYAALILLVIGSKLAIYKLSQKGKIAALLITILSNTAASTGRHSVILLVIALLIFFHVLSRKPAFYPGINKIASCCLGVYLFHESYVLGMKNTLDAMMDQLISRGFFAANLLFPIEYILAVLAVFAAGIFLEWIRNEAIQKPFMKYISLHFQSQIEKANQWFNSF